MACRNMGRADIPELRDQIEAEVERWARCGHGDDDIVVCLSAGRSFRYWIWPSYKANRKKQDPPPMLGNCFDILKHDYYTWMVDGLEGDDGLGILATGKEDTIIITIDKDLLQVPGLHFNPDKDETPYEIEPHLAAWHEHIQWLMGDSSDNLPGLPRVGIKTAIKILEGIMDPAEMTAKVGQEYVDRGYTMHYCHQMRDCVHILTRTDYPSYRCAS
ncbi:MAG: hypothetical protein QQN63_05255 [Nitrosopumilus sp.]